MNPKEKMFIEMVENLKKNFNMKIRLLDIESAKFMKARGGRGEKFIYHAFTPQDIKEFEERGDAMIDFINGCAAWLVKVIDDTPEDLEDKHTFGIVVSFHQD